MLIETVLLGTGQPKILIEYFSKSVMVMKKINNFWHVKPRSFRVQNVACYISSLFFFWSVDRLWLTTVCSKPHFIILSYDSFLNKMVASRQMKWFWIQANRSFTASKQHHIMMSIKQTSSFSRSPPVNRGCLEGQT